MTTPISGEQHMQKEINRRKFVCDLSKGAALAVLGSMTGCVHSIIPKGERPNILLILMDDLGRPSLGCTGNRNVPTPHLDRLASEGMLFMDAYVTPQRSPTRASLLTGQHTARNRFWHVLPRYGYPYAYMEEPVYAENLSAEAPIFPRILRDNGYRTACIGKWHLHSGTDGDYERIYQHAKEKYGFDTVAPDDETRGCHNGDDECVDYLTDETIRFIEANRSRPFFVYLSHYAVHRVVRAREELVRKYKAMGYPAAGIMNATYLAAIEQFDTAIGRILRRLDEMGLRQNTIVVFLSDNGGVAEEFPNTPLRSGKGTLYEGGIRVPLIIRWPGHVTEGTTCDTPVHVVDFFPTLLALTGCQAPQTYVMDGLDISPLFDGTGRIQRDAIYTYAPLYDTLWGATPGASIRRGKYKLIEYFGDYIDIESENRYILGRRLELYDLDRDQGEQNNLASENPELADDLSKQLRDWIKSTGAPIPQRNSGYDPKRPLEKVGGLKG
jgi:arylsulfatase A